MSNHDDIIETAREVLRLAVYLDTALEVETRRRLSEAAPALARYVLEHAAAKRPSAPLPHCHSARDGECQWRDCPQLRDNEPAATGRHCPLDCEECHGDGHCPKHNEPPSAPPAAERKAVGDMLFDAPPSAPAEARVTPWTHQQALDDLRAYIAQQADRDRARAELVRRARELCETARKAPASKKGWGATLAAIDALAELLEEPSE